MKVRNVSDGVRTIAETGQKVPPGGTVQVSEPLGRSLCRQHDVWEAEMTEQTEEGDG